MSAVAWVEILDKVARNLCLLIVVASVSAGLFFKLIDGNQSLGFAGTIVGLVLGAKAVQQGVRAAQEKPPAP
jgi:hypothetical protein